MYNRSVNSSLIISLGVAVNAGRLRFFLSSEHTEDEVRNAVRTAKEEFTFF